MVIGVRETAGGRQGLLAIVGSSLMWAWLDGVFMSVLFPSVASGGALPEVGAVVIYLASALACAVLLWFEPLARKALTSRRALVAFGVCGTSGSLLFVFASIAALPAFLVVGGVLGGAYMAIAQIAWGAVYCRDGQRSATALVSASMACAAILDIPLLFMMPVARAVIFSLLPVASAMAFVRLPEEARAYAAMVDRGMEPPRNPMAYVRNYLGISATLFLAIMLVMTGFGYVQHLISFAGLPGAEPAVGYGVILQVCRGCVAVVLFALVMAVPHCVSGAYRAGLLVMIAGFMAMSVTFGTRGAVVAGAAVIGGYTVFDLLKWCVFSEVAHSQSRNSLKTIAIMRLTSSVCYLLGTVAGLAVGDGTVAITVPVPAVVMTNVVGYLVVIATVLLLSSEDIWALFAPVWMARAGVASEDDAPDSDDIETKLDDEFGSIGLTPRERDVAMLLVRGRTQPWIAEFLGISESTVDTHVRHIYQKAGVHTRQEFLDKLSL